MFSILAGSSNSREGERNLKARNYAEAEKFLKLAVEEADTRRHLVRRIQFRLELAEAQRNQGKLAEAENAVRAALEITARVSNPSGFLQALDALAEIFHDAGNYTAMEDTLQQSDRLEASVPHPDPVRIARRVHRLGTARQKDGRPAEALPVLEKALRLHENTFGAEHLETANLLSDLGAVYRGEKRHEEAQQVLRRAMRIHERQLGHFSDEAMRDLNHLAGSLEESGKIDGAAELYERLLLLRERIVGGDLDELAEMQFDLAGMYIGWSNYARARELLAEAIGIFKGKKGPRLAVAYETVAHVEECQGRYLEAVAELAQAGEIWETSRHTTELVANMDHRADLLESLNKKEEAEWLRHLAAELLASKAEAATP